MSFFYYFNKNVTLEMTCLAYKVSLPNKQYF